MKKVFAKTGNVNAFVSAMTRLSSRQDGIPGMALVFGEPGLGKTRTALWWAATNDGVYLRTKKLMTGHWLLEELCGEMGQGASHKTSALFRQCVDQLLDKPRTVIVDEVDYLCHDPRVIETLRDLHDITGTPFVFLGMDTADKKLARFKHLYDRFSEILQFKVLTLADVKGVAEQMCEVKLSEDAVKYIYNENQGNRFRRVLRWLYKAENIAVANSLKEITRAHLNGGRK